jgi:hypothetical protein
MGIKKTRELPRRLQSVRRRIERWRQTRKVRSAIPDALWAVAVRMANVYGMNRTARALRLNYYGLKKRVEQQVVAATDVAAMKGAVPFIELAPLASTGHCECLLELEKAGGARMRIQLKGVAAPDLAALSQAFWNGRP